MNAKKSMYNYQSQLRNDGTLYTLFEFGTTNTAVWKYDSKAYQLLLTNKSSNAPLYISYSGVAYTFEMGKDPVPFASSLPGQAFVEVPVGMSTYFYPYLYNPSKLSDYDPRMSANGKNTYIICDRISIETSNDPNLLYVFNCNNEGVGGNNLILMTGDAVRVQS